MIDVLLVEDHLPDRVMVRKSLAGSNITLHEAVDGMDGWIFLTKSEPYTGKPSPDIILLDLNMPRMDGRDLIEKVKSDPDLRRIPIIVMTSSEAEKDIVESYNLGVSSYLVKPVNFDQFRDAVSSLKGYYLVTATLPPNEDD